jgi:erythromycin esterase
MKYQTLSILLLLSYCTSSAQIKEYVLSEYKSISTISPLYTNYADFAPIGDAIGDARIVMLGEQDHGDATTFEAKTRIVRYLCEQKGFDVLLFESDFWGLNDGWHKTPRQPDSLQRFLKSNVYPIWTNCHGCQYLFETWLPNYASQHPSFEVSGFDPQFVLWWSKRHLKLELDSLLKRYFPENVYLRTNQNVLNDLTDYVALENDTLLFAKRMEYLDTLELALIGQFGAHDFWVQSCRNFKVCVLKSHIREEDPIGSSNLRDEMMAQNLIWLTQHKYKNRKVIVWAANSHIFKLNNCYENKYLNMYQFMGAQFLLQSELRDSVYVLGFTSARGEGGRLGSKPYTFKPGLKSGFEKWLSKGGVKYAFVDFVAFNQPYADNSIAFRMAGGGTARVYHHLVHEAPWHRIFDGVFYIRDMERCRPIKIGPPK